MAVHVDSDRFPQYNSSSTTTFIQVARAKAALQGSLSNVPELAQLSFSNRVPSSRGPQPSTKKAPPWLTGLEPMSTWISH